MSFADLMPAAMEARGHAYVPYSRYPVGAALLDDHHRIWTGCNVENVSFGLTICAERTAIVKMASAGARRWTHLVVVTRDGGTPCGACLQVLAEFAAPDAEVLVADEGGSTRTFRFKELLPYGFTTDLVE